eukprot:14269691-Alexandrium_andersonii.AAC.1
MTEATHHVSSFLTSGAFKGVHGALRGSQYVDLSDLRLSAPSQLARAIRGLARSSGLRGCWSSS